MCINGKHDLIVIYSHRALYNEEPTVRWCVDCGAVVVDMDYDNRTNAGQIMKMKFPESTKIKESEINNMRINRDLLNETIKGAINKQYLGGVPPSAYCTKASIITKAVLKDINKWAVEKKGDL